VNTQNFEKDAQLARDIEIFRIVTEHFRQDIREFWTRANFYLLAHAGLFSAFAMTYPTLIKYHATIALTIPILGLIIAIVWFIVLRGTIYWLERWREQVIKLAKELDRFQCYVEVESSTRQKRFLSPSYVTQFLPLIFAIIWLAILVLIFAEWQIPFST